MDCELGFEMLHSQSLDRMMVFPGKSMSKPLYPGIIRSDSPPVPDSFDVVVWSRCVSDWDPIDGHRFGVGDVTWTTNEQHFRFTVTKNAYWPCSYSRTYITNANGSDVRTLEDDENIEWYIPANPDPFRGFYNSSTR
jgi:hypothetical protein